MTTTVNKVHADLLAAKQRLGTLRDAAPDAFEGFSTLSRLAMADGALTAGHKELAAVAISCVLRSDDCVLYHVDAARRAGADETQLIEMLQVAVELGGGPAVEAAGRALDVWRALGDEREAA